ncbi:MAG: nucleotidyltransferase domain-containing protein [Bacteroidetes bacterium]|nr:MAG: nucleotidyltransferase domain-containing protein [Bacteroidota bacterium]
MKKEDNNIAKRISESIRVIDSKAQILIFGSRARGDAKRESDWDILILTDYPVSTYIERSFRNNLFDLEIETGEVFSTFVYQKSVWNTKHKVTPIYRNIKKEGVRL